MQKRSSHLLLPVLLGAGVVFAAEVSADYDHKTDFSRYHTYSWLAVRAGNSLWQDRIMRAVDSELAAKGWTRVASGGDAVISAFGRTQEQDTLETYYSGFPGWGWHGWGGIGAATTTVAPERVGNLTVDIFDGQSKQLIWRANASDVLTTKPEKNEKKLEHTVAKMFERFPPRTRG